MKLKEAMLQLQLEREKNFQLAAELADLRGIVKAVSGSLRRKEESTEMAELQVRIFI